MITSERNEKLGQKVHNDCLTLHEWQGAEIFCPETIFWFWVPYEWPGMVSLSDIAARRLSRGTAVRTFYCCSAAGCKLMLQHSLLNSGKRYGAGPRGIFINVHPGMDFSPPGSSCLIKSLVFLSARADWEERLVLTIRGTPIICRTFQESSKNSSHSQ